MSHHVPGPPDYDVVMTEQVPGLNGPKMLGRHKPTAPNQTSLRAQQHERGVNKLALKIFYEVIILYLFGNETDASHLLMFKFI